MASVKRKSTALIDSDSSDSGSDSELLNIGAKRAKIEEKPQTTQDRPNSDSDTSDSDSDWGQKKSSKKKKKPLPKTKSKQSKSTDSEPEEGELSSASSDEGSGSGNSSNEGSSDGSGDEEFDDGLDENYCKDEEDRLWLESLTEKEREQEIFNRIEKREIQKKRFEIEKKLRLVKKAEQNKNKEKTGSGKEKTDKKDKSNGGPVTVPADRKKTLEENKAGRSEKFAALKAKRDKKKEETAKREAEEEEKSPPKASKLNASQVFSSDDEEDYKPAAPTASKAILESSSSESEKESDKEDSDKEDSDKEKKKKKKKVESDGSGSDSDGSRSGSSDGSTTSSAKPRTGPKLVDNVKMMERIRLSRHKMEKFVHMPLFAKAIIGCFVRVGIGNNMGRSVYRVAEIIEVCETAKVYSLGTTKTNKGVRLRHANQDRVFRLEFISNQKFSENEFTRYLESCKNHNVLVPTADHVCKKEKDIRDLLDYRYTNDDVDTIISERNRFSSKPTNYAIAKTEVRKRKEMAIQRGDDAEVEECNEQIARLDTTSIRLEKRRNQTISSILYINDRNRKQNIVKAEEAIMAEAAERKGVRLSDPFTRRQTRPQIVTKSSFKGTMTEEETKQLMVERKIKVDKEIKAKEAEEQRKRDAHLRTKEEDRKRVQEEDVYAAHDFDLNIDFGSSFDASVGSNVSKTVPVTPSQLETPRRSLNLEEYKRKKGLI